MSSRRAFRDGPPRTDRDVLGDARDMAILRAVEGGQVVRPAGSVAAPFLLDGTPVMLRRLAREDLLFAPISGPPRLAPRGVRLLAVSRGEQSLSTEE